MIGVRTTCLEPAAPGVIRPPALLARGFERAYNLCADHLEITPRPEECRNVLRLNTLGRAYATRDGARLAGATAQPRRLALLAILAAAGERGVSREKIVALLWPDAEEERARKGLNQALYALRQDLGSDEAIAGTRDLRLEAAIVGTDVARFRSALARGELERAVDEYAGPFLDGFTLTGAPEFERWMEAERAVLAREYITALDRLAKRADDQGDHATSVDWLRRLAARDPLDARTAVRLMEALTRAGDATGALQHARVYELLIQQELDVPPDPQVVALAARIRQEMRTTPTEQRVVTADPDTGPPVPRQLVEDADRVEFRPEEQKERKEGQQSEPARETQSTERAQSVAPVLSPLSAVPSVPSVERERPSRPRADLSRHWRALAVAAAAIIVVVLLSKLQRPASVAGVALGETHKLTLDPGLEVDASPNPDGSVVAYAAGLEGAMRLFVRQVNGGRAVAISGDLPGDHRRPRWSPDGASLLFQANGGIWLVPSLGGVPRQIVDAPRAGGRALYPAWSPDGRSLAWVHGDTVLARPLDGGAARTVGVLREAHSLAWSPDGRWIAAVEGNAEFLYGAVRMLPGQTSIGNVAPSALWVLPAEGGTPVRLTDDDHLNTSPEWLDERRLLFVSDRYGIRDLFVVSLDDAGRPASDPARVTTGLGALSAGVSRDGRTLAYTMFSQRANVWSLPIADSGTLGTTEARPVTSGAQTIEGIDVSPDGRWLAFDADRPGRQGIFRLSTDCGAAACGEPEPVVESGEGSYRPSWAPDGGSVVFYMFEKGVRHAFTVAAHGTPRPLLPAAWGEVHSPVLSPDGRRLTFHRDFDGASQLFESVRTGDSTWSRPRQLTHRGGWGARWSPDGRQLVYLAPNQIRLMGAAGESDSRVVYDAASSAGPTELQPVWLRWGSDSRTLYMKTFDAAGAASLWALSLACLPASANGCPAPRQLVRFDEPLRPTLRPEFATDGRRLYFTLAERESDLWYVRLSGR